MRTALVVFESMFGNTARIAGAVGDGLGVTLAVDVLEVGAAPTDLVGFNLMVVGAPTHGHGLSTPQSRASAAGKIEGDTVSTGIGIREWIERLEGDPTLVRAAVFDTRIKGPALLWGSAARQATEQLRHLGVMTVADAESFFVSGPFGSVTDALVDGELERARRWGVDLAARLESTIAAPG